MLVACCDIDVVLPPTVVPRVVKEPDRAVTSPSIVDTVEVKPLMAVLLALRPVVESLTAFSSAVMSDDAEEIPFSLTVTLELNADTAVDVAVTPVVASLTVASRAAIFTAAAELLDEFI